MPWSCRKCGDEIAVGSPIIYDFKIMIDKSTEMRQRSFKLCPKCYRGFQCFLEKEGSEPE